MQIIDHTSAKKIKAYCKKIGSDPILVQGPGGNVSWKEGDLLWMKASGKWLKNAENEDIFIPVDLKHLKEMIRKKKFTANPKVKGDYTLKPSIETMLHALMPHKIVVHIHDIEILAHLVRINPCDDLRKIVGESVKWAYVDYYKPGAELAKAIFFKIPNLNDIDVIFLKSHGVVIGGADIKFIKVILKKLYSILKTKKLKIKKNLLTSQEKDSLLGKYYLSKDLEINQLATVEELSSRLISDWALYPDHIVFLGKEPFIISEESHLQTLEDKKDKPYFIFYIGRGVYENTTATDVHKSQLKCYYNILVRQKKTYRLSSLSKKQIEDLLKWDAEKYRKIIN